MANPIVSDEYAHAINGVAGRMFARTIGGNNYKADTFTSQKWSASREYNDHGARLRMIVKMRFDDNCRNGHNTFSITCDINEYRGNAWRDFGGGAAHDDIARVFPELAPLNKWHLVSSDSPMHYIANTVYHASDRDHHGKRVGEPWAFDMAIQFGSNPIKHVVKDGFWKFLRDYRSSTGMDDKQFDFQIIDISEQKTGSTGNIEYYRGYTFGGYGARWYDCPFKTESAALDFLIALQTCEPSFVKVPTLFSEGKARDFAAARATAIWPEATDEILSLDKADLTAKLQERHPALMAAFRADMEACGFIWSPAV